MWEAGSGRCGESNKHLRKFRVGTLNVNTLRGRVCEVVETLSHRKVDVCCIQETRYRGGSCRTIKGKDTRYKLYWSGNDKGIAGVGVFVAGEWIEKVFEVQRVSRQNYFSETHSRPVCGYLTVCVCPTEWSKWWGYGPVLWSAACCDCQDPGIRISDPMWRLERLCRPWRHWIQGSAWWNGVWQAGTRCWGWENPRVRHSIWPASWEHMFQETWQPSHHVQIGKHSHADRLYSFP